MKTTPAAQCDLRTAVNAARAFATLADTYFSEIPPDKDQAHLHVAARFGALAAATTNLVLAIELFLKSEAIVTKKPVLHTHDLSILFDALPTDVQSSVEAAYRLEENKAPPDETAGIEVWVSKKRAEPKKAEVDAARKSIVPITDLRSLLSAEVDAFETWRYFFQEAPQGPVSIFRANFRRLTALAKVLESDVLRRSNPQTA